MIKISIIIPIYNVEKYIAETLQSIREQTFSDYEVIIINDGSTDHSQIEIDKFCKKDCRFKCFKKQNEGVAVARNFGINVMQGEYVLFVDGDDILPSNALEALYKRAKEKKADAVIGIMQRFDMEGVRVYKRTEEIAQKDEIDKFDPLLCWSFSVCNKLLRTEIIRTNHLQFEKIKHAEDGLFLFEFIYKCNTIAGCASVVYKYRRRVSWEDKSATQAASQSYLIDLLYAVDKIINLAKTQQLLEMEKCEQIDDQDLLYTTQIRDFFDEFLSTLHCRIIDVSLLHEYYRRIWQIDDTVFDIIQERIISYKRCLFPRMWDEIIQKNTDLRLEHKLMNKEELCRNPLFTIAISDTVPESEIPDVFKSVFSQRLPAFVVYVQGRQKHSIPLFYQKQQNVIICSAEMDTVAFKKYVIENAISPYIHFIDEPIYVNENTYKDAYLRLEKRKNVDYVSCKIKLIEADGKIKECRPHEIVFFEKYRKAHSKSIYQAFDYLMGNKLLRLSSLKKHKIRLSNDTLRDGRLCCEQLNGEKANKVCVAMPISEAAMVKRVQNRCVRFSWKCRYAWEMRTVRKRDKQKISDKIKKLLYACLPVERKVLFITNRIFGISNCEVVYDAYNGRKTIIYCDGKQSKLQKWKLGWNLRTSQLIVLDDYYYALRSYTLKSKQRLIQLWHASGAYKKFGLDNDFANIQDERKCHIQYSAVAVSSEAVRDKYAKAFGISEDRIIATGNPRTDKLLDEHYLQNKKEWFYKLNANMKDKKIILYAPTFREKSGKQIEFKPPLNWEKLNLWLENENAVMIIKKHPFMKEDFFDGEPPENILTMPSNDIISLLIVCDVVITDYSSIIFETALLNKPLVLFCPDLDTYERGFYLKIPEDLYGKLAKNHDELLDSCKHVLKKVDLERIEIFRKRYLDACDGGSTQRVVSLIEAMQR